MVNWYQIRLSLNLTQPSLMSGDRLAAWHGLERVTHRAFLIGALLFLGAASLNVNTVLGGTERLSLMVGEALIAVGWLSGLLGVLGLVAGLRDPPKWTTRIGVAGALLGILSYVVLAVASLLAYVQGGGVGDLPVPFILLFPGILVGTLLGFVAISIVIVRGDEDGSAVGGLLVAPPVIMLSNFFVLPIVIGTGPYPPEVILGVTSLLALDMGLLGYLLRKRVSEHSSPEPTAEPLSE